MNVFRKVAKQIPYALQNAVNATLRDARVAVQDEMRRVFDRPTPITLKSVYVNYSRDKRNIDASIGLINPADVTGDISTGEFIPHKRQDFQTPPWLVPEIQGGGRDMKTFEMVLRVRGILPPGMQVVPARDAWLDQYGNVPRQEIAQILSSLEAFQETGFAMNRTRRSRGSVKTRYFVMRRAGRPIGIWERLDNRPGSHNTKAVLMFVGLATYKSRLNFNAVILRTISARFGYNYQRAYQQAIDTAK